MKKHLYFIILGIILFGVGIIFTVYQINSFSFSDKKISTITNVKTYEGDYKYKVKCDYCKINYIYQNVDNTEIKITYPSNYYNYEIDEEVEGDTKILDIDITNVIKKNVFDLVLNDLKNGIVRDYYSQYLMRVDIITNKVK